MITKIYQVFRYHRKLFIIMSLFFISCEAQTLKNFQVQDGVYAKYEGFEEDEIYKGLYQLEFSIINDTNDTVFLNRNQIKITCRNGKKKLQDEYSKFSKNLGEGQKVVIPQKLSESEISNRKRHREVKERFVNKYLSNYNIDESEFQMKKEKTIQQLIVVFPKESKEYKTEFYNELYTQDTNIDLDCSCVLK